MLLAHLGTDIEPAAEAAERVLAEPLPGALTQARQFTFLGTGWTTGLASEAALKLREAAGLWSESYPAMEFRHGPIAVTGPGSMVWMLGRAPDGLAQDVASAGGQMWQSAEPPLAELVPGAPGRGRAGQGGGPGPGPAAQPDQVGDPGRGGAGAARTMIVVVSLNPALDVTHYVDGADWSGVNRPHEVHVRAGGKGLNVARTLRALGQPVLLAGLAGGCTGQALAAGLASTGIEARLTSIAAETRRTFVVADSARGQTALFNEPGPPVTAAEFAEFSAAYERAASGAAVVVLSGSLPPGLPDDAYAGLTAIAAGAGVPVILDASGAPLRLGAAAGPALIKPNLAELEALAGRELRTGGEPDLPAIEQTARELAAAGPGASTFGGSGGRPPGQPGGGSGGRPPGQHSSAVVVSLGAAGLLATGPDGTWHARPPGPVAGNPTGAGDAVVAGLADSLVRGQDWPATLRHAVALGSAAAGAVVAGEFAPADYDRLVTTVEVAGARPDGGETGDQRGNCGDRRGGAS